jgi:uncharacterized protein YbjT (DUF2867 family)
MSEELKREAPGRGRIVTVLGGTGFLGRRVVRHLLDHGFMVRAASRHAGRVAELFPSDGAGPEPVAVEVHEEASVAAALASAQGVVNAVSLYVERGGRETFRAVHVEAAARVARLARQAGIGRLVHLSGIGADAAAASAYVRARGEGEVAVRQAFPEATILRPSVMFGPDDRFLTTLARLVRTLPAVPLFGRGGTRLQPVHVEDVAEAVARILAEPGAARPCHEFGGPRIYTYAALLRAVADGVGARRPWLVPVPFALWQALAGLAERLPGAPLTRDQVALMRRDNLASAELPGLPELGIAPTPIEDILPAIAAGGSGGTR